MVKSQIMGREKLSAVLTGKPVAQEHVEPGEGRAFGGPDIFLEGDDAGQGHFQAGRADHPVVFGDRVDPAHKRGFHRILPGPEGEREIAQRTKIRVQHQCRTIPQRDVHYSPPRVRETYYCYFEY